MKKCPNITPKTTISHGLAITLFALAATLAAGHTAPVVYTSSYSGSTLPNATAGTFADPLWHFGVPSGTFIASSNGDVLNASTTGIASTQWWAVGTSSNTTWAGSTPNVWNTSTATVDFRLQVISGEGGNAATGNGFMIQLSDLNNKFYSFYIGPTAFTFQNGASTSLSVTTSSLGIDTSLYHTYRVAMSDGIASLYIDTLVDPIFSTVAGVALGANRTSILFGDGSSAESGAFNLDSISWSNATAEFSAPIPEPATVALMGIAAMAVIFRARRKVSWRKRPLS